MRVPLVLSGKLRSARGLYALNVIDFTWWWRIELHARAKIKAWMPAVRWDWVAFSMVMAGENRGLGSLSDTT
jgi:hypothetical protein